MKYETTGGTRRCLAKGSPHPSLTYDTLTFSGTPDSYIEVPVSDAKVFSDISISVAVFATAVSDGGTIFHYQTAAPEDPAYNLYITDLVLWFSSLGVVHVDVYGPSGTLQIQLSSTSSYVMPVNEFVTFLLQIDISKPEMVVYSTINNNYEIGSADWTMGDNRYIRLPGIMRIGAGKDPSVFPPLHGIVTCLGVHDDKLKLYEVPNILTGCSPGTWTSLPPNNTGTCEQEKYKGLFKRIQTNFGLPSTRQSILTVSARSRVTCSDRCLHDDTCISFTFDRSSDTCSLYDDDFRSELLVAVNTDYYVKRDSLCC